MPWEYMHVSAGTNQMDTMIRTLNRLGAEEWEVVGLATPDKTLGFNAMVCVLKRHYEPMATPEDPSPGWKSDPAGHGQRWWTGQHWSARVTDGTTESSAWPRLAATVPTQPPPA